MVFVLVPLKRNVVKASKTIFKTTIPQLHLILHTPEGEKTYLLKILNSWCSAVFIVEYKDYSQS